MRILVKKSGVTSSPGPLEPLSATSSSSSYGLKVDNSLKVNRLVYLTKFPIPCSHNRLYDHVTRRTSKGKIYQARKKSDKYLDFERQVQIYQFQNRSMIETAKSLLLPYKNHPLAIEISFYIHRPRLVTLKGHPKRFDVHNLMKAGFDTLSLMLGVDDSVFFEETIRKVPIEIYSEEGADISIHPLSPL